MQLVTNLKRDTRIPDLQESIEEYKLPFDSGYLRYKLGWSLNFADAAIAEYKRFVSLALRSDQEVTPSSIVDEVWHYHILHTRDYAKFAEQVGNFLHHNPGTSEEMPRFSKQYQETLDLYRRVFQQEPPVDIWPRQSLSAESVTDLKLASFTREDPEQVLIIEARKHLNNNLQWSFFEHFRQFVSEVESKHAKFIIGNTKNAKSISNGVLHRTYGMTYQSANYTARMLKEHLGIKALTVFEKALLMSMLGSKYTFCLDSDAASPVFKPLIRRINEIGYSMHAEINWWSGVTYLAKFLHR
jgi:hypothetical protein